MAAPKKLNEAVVRWEAFHDKEHRELLEYPFKWPARWALAGRMVTTYYESDKWRDDGDYDLYYHDHGDEVWCYVPVDIFDWAAEENPPFQPDVNCGAVLAISNGWNFERADSGKLVEMVVPKDSLLCSSPDGKYLFLVDPDRGILALIVGDSLAVKPEGILG